MDIHLPFHTIKSLKNSAFGSTVLSENIQSEPFSLTLLTYDSLHRPDIITLLSQWRKKHEHLFESTFPITDERTKSWLEKRVLDVPDRLLFMIKFRQKYRGHVGLYRFSKEDNTIDLDNIVRGIDGGKGLMSMAIIRMMEWAKQELGVSGFTLQTTSDNSHAVQFYERLGFIETKRVPYIFKKTEEGGVWEKAPADTTEEIKRYEVYMKKL